ncbi:MAG: PEFG-CTERM sorting domain-containing protein [Nitrosopumilales archaeon]|nr:PEFG-CTERM sorting domain-containing protein [Nitrosopumilales archaeon]
MTTLRFLFFPIVVILFALTIISSQNVFGAPQLSSCPSCVIIPPDEIEFYKKNVPLVIWTDNLLYDHDSIVTVNGHSKLTNREQPITITVFDPLGGVIEAQQVIADEFGDFKIRFNTNGAFWSSDGEYIIKAQISQDILFKTKIELVPELGGIPQCSTSELTTPSDTGATFCIPFTRTGKITSVESFLDTKSKSLILTLRGATNYDPLVIDLPRYILDSKSGTSDSSFVVLVDGNQIEYEELFTTEDNRKISIAVPPSLESQIEIIGTQVIPEFGPVAILVLISAIASVLVLNTKNIVRVPRF